MLILNISLHGLIFGALSLNFAFYFSQKTMERVRISKPKKLTSAELAPELDHWCTSGNIIKMSPNEAKDLISKAKDKSTVSVKLANYVKKLDRLDEMDPDTVTELFKFNPLKRENIEWANQRYEIDFSWWERRIKSIKKLA